MIWIWLVVAGLAGGLMGGMGMGGGTLLIPILTIFLDIPQINAQAVNLISFVPMAAASLIVHIKNKLVNFKQVMLVAPLAIGTCLLGAFFSNKVAPEILSKIFGTFMVVIGVLFIFKIIIAEIVGVLSTHRDEKKVFFNKFIKK